MMSRRTSGSPPVILILRVPILMKVEQSRSNSSRERTSRLGRNDMSSDMQYTHRKSHRSVTETRMYVIARPNPSTRAGVWGKDPEKSSSTLLALTARNRFETDERAQHPRFRRFRFPRRSPQGRQRRSEA